MPLTQQSLQPKTGPIAVWKITEEVSELQRLLTLNPHQQQALEQRQTLNGKKATWPFEKPLIPSDKI